MVAQQQPQMGGQSNVRMMPERTGWTDWAVFGAVVMMIVGVFNVIEGLVALFKDEFFLVTQKGFIVNIDVTAVGWTLLAFGAVAILTGAFLVRGTMWARVVGVVFVGLNAVAQLAFMNLYPWWAVAIIAVDLLVIYAITAHGRELKA
jgi:hypothetical protein